MHIHTNGDKLKNYEMMFGGFKHAFAIFFDVYYGTTSFFDPETFVFL